MQRLLRRQHEQLRAERETAVSEIPAYRDPLDEGNSAYYHTGKPCITTGCEKPAGTWWGPYWCFDCNVAHIERINRKFEEWGGVWQ